MPILLERVSHISVVADIGHEFGVQECVSLIFHVSDGDQYCCGHDYEHNGKAEFDQVAGILAFLLELNNIIVTLRRGDLIEFISEECSSGVAAIIILETFLPSS